GTRSNRDGLGALVRVRVGERTLSQFHDGKSGYLAQSALPLYFGLGESSPVRAVEILWPSGLRQRVTEGIPTNGVLTVTEAVPGGR
ncbi:MAG: ASPIC/UnbV domain-containing protein, partial [Verrucomicrobiota bacterium]